MGYYTSYSYVEGRFGLPFLTDLLSDQIPDDTADNAIQGVLSAYIEAEIAKIDALIDAACIRQITVPVSTTNKAFAILKGVAEALILRKVASHTQQDDIPSKIENEFVASMRTLGQIMRSEMILTQEGQTGPGNSNDAMKISDPEETPFHISMEDAW